MPDILFSDCIEELLDEKLLLINTRTFKIAHKKLDIVSMDLSYNSIVCSLILFEIVNQSDDIVTLSFCDKTLDQVLL